MRTHARGREGEKRVREREEVRGKSSPRDRSNFCREERKQDSGGGRERGEGDHGRERKIGGERGVRAREKGEREGESEERERGRFASSRLSS